MKVKTIATFAALSMLVLPRAVMAADDPLRVEAFKCGVSNFTRLSILNDSQHGFGSGPVVYYAQADSSDANIATAGGVAKVSTGRSPRFETGFRTYSQEVQAGGVNAGTPVAIANSFVLFRFRGSGSGSGSLRFFEVTKSLAELGARGTNSGWQTIRADYRTFTGTPEDVRRCNLEEVTFYCKAGTPGADFSEAKFGDITITTGTNPFRPRTVQTNIDGCELSPFPGTNTALGRILTRIKKFESRRP